VGNAVGIPCSIRAAVVVSTPLIPTYGPFSAPWETFSRHIARGGGASAISCCTISCCCTMRWSNSRSSFVESFSGTSVIINAVSTPSSHSR